MTDDATISKLIENVNKKVNITDKNIGIEEVEAKTLVISSKNSIELSVKDFSRNYEGSIVVLQNELGFFDRVMKSVKSDGKQRVVVFYNSIVSEGDSYFKESQYSLLPIRFQSGDLNVPLQKSFNLLKSLSMIRIYSNNYLRHCVHKPIEEEDKTEKETMMDFCVIFLETKKNRVSINKIETKQQYNEELAIIDDKEI